MLYSVFAFIVILVLSMFALVPNTKGAYEEDNSYPPGRVQVKIHQVKDLIIINLRNNQSAGIDTLRVLVRDHVISAAKGSVGWNHTSPFNMGTNQYFVHFLAKKPLVYDGKAYFLLKVNGTSVIVIWYASGNGKPIAEGCNRSGCFIPE